jgi:hypothetical protein
MFEADLLFYTFIVTMKIKNIQVMVPCSQFTRLSFSKLNRLSYPESRKRMWDSRFSNMVNTERNVFWDVTLCSFYTNRTFWRNILSSRTWVPIYQVKWHHIPSQNCNLKKTDNLCWQLLVTLCY